MKTIFLLLLAVPCIASGPKYVGTTTDPNVYQEFVNVYHDISNPSSNVGSVTTMTITNLVGTKTNDSALAGNVGEYTSCSQHGNTNFAASGQYSDGCSFSLTAGDWDLSASLYATLNGATSTAIRLGIGTVSGNDSTGSILPDSQARGPAPTASSDASLVIPAVRVSIASTTTYYCKVFASYSAGTPQFMAFMRARRIR